MNDFCHYSRPFCTRNSKTVSTVYHEVFRLSKTRLVDTKTNSSGFTRNRFSKSNDRSSALNRIQTIVNAVLRVTFADLKSGLRPRSSAPKTVISRERIKEHPRGVAEYVFLRTAFFFFFLNIFVRREYRYSRVARFLGRGRVRIFLSV